MRPLSIALCFAASALVYCLAQDVVAQGLNDDSSYIATSATQDNFPASISDRGYSYIPASASQAEFSASISDRGYNFVPASVTQDGADDAAPVDADDDGFADNLDSAAGTTDSAAACCEGCGSIYAGFEFTTLFPHGGEYVEIHSHTGLDNLPGIPFGAHPDGGAFDLTRPWGYRAWAGAENCCGQGLRVTYWQWEDSAEFGGIDFDADNNLETSTREIDIWTLDVEGTQSMCYCDTTIIGTLGARLANFQYDTFYHEFATVSPLAHTSEREFTGVGITGSIEGRRPLPCLCNWEGFARLRGSMVFGNTDFAVHAHNFNVFDDIDVNFDVTGQIQYQTYMIWETQVGVERHWCMSMGTFFVKAAFEAQLWEVPPTYGVGDINLGLLGAAFGAGFSR